MDGIMEIKDTTVKYFNEMVDRYSLHPVKGIVQKIERVFDILEITEGINSESVIDNGLHVIDEHAYAFDDYKENFIIEVGMYYASLDVRGDAPNYFYEFLSLADNIRFYTGKTISEENEVEEMIYFRLYFKCNNGGTDDE